jgi:hypothetical protein
MLIRFTSNKMPEYMFVSGGEMLHLNKPDGKLRLRNGTPVNLIETQILICYW